MYFKKVIFQILFSVLLSFRLGFFSDLVVPLVNAYRLRGFLQGSSLFYQQFSGSARSIHGNSSPVFVEDYSKLSLLDLLLCTSIDDYHF